MRCHICDATSDGWCTLVPWKGARKFSVVEEKPWLEICTDCSVFGQAGSPENVSAEFGDLPVLEGGWDD